MFVETREQRRSRAEPSLSALQDTHERPQSIKNPPRNKKYYVQNIFFVTCSFVNATSPGVKKSEMPTSGNLKSGDFSFLPHRHQPNLNIFCTKHKGIPRRHC